MRNQYKVLSEKYQLVTEQTEEPVMTIDKYGTKEWWVNGELHRTDGPAYEGADGIKAWYLNGELHRTGGPAIEDLDGYKEWFLNNKRHRTDGPAYEGADGCLLYTSDAAAKRIV